MRLLLSLLAITLPTTVLAAALATIPATQPQTMQPSIAPFPHNRPAAIVYTFDDNLRDQFTLAVPILTEFNVKATFFIIPGKTPDTPAAAEAIQPSDDGKRNGWGSISWPELKSLADQGHEIASHTLSHPNLPKLPLDKAEEEIKKARDLITARLGTPPLTIAFPYNACNPDILNIAQKYHLAARTFQTGAGPDSTPEKLNAWANDLAANQKLGILMIHAMKTGYAPFPPEAFRAHLQYVTSHPELFHIDTFANLSRYTLLRNTTTLTTLSSTPTATTLSLTTTSTNPTLTSTPLTLVIPLPPNITNASATRNNTALPTQLQNNLLLLETAPSPAPITITFSP